jgi:hypothetical protein
MKAKQVNSPITSLAIKVNTLTAQCHWAYLKNLPHLTSIAFTVGGTTKCVAFLQRVRDFPGNLRSLSLSRLKMEDDHLADILALHDLRSLSLDRVEFGA